MHHLPPILYLHIDLDALRSARSAYGTSDDVAGRTLMLVMRLFALGEQEPFENVMIDKVPRQQLIVSVMPGDEKIGIRQIGISSFDFAMNLRQLMPDGTAAVESGGFEPFEDSGDAPIAAGDHRLEIRLARRFSIELDLPEPGE